MSACHDKKNIWKGTIETGRDLVDYHYSISLVRYLQQTIRTWIAESRMELDQVRLLVLQAAQVIDTGGPKSAKKEVRHSLQ